MSIDPNQAIAQLAREDGRYQVEAYFFIFESLAYAQEVLGMGSETPSEDEPDQTDKPTEQERHLTGQELCEAIRLYARRQFGLMAKCVLNSWGVHTTGDFGEIVFNMIRAGRMKKNTRDRREDFQDVFDFDKGLISDFNFKLS